MKKVLITYHMTNGEEDAETCIALPMADEVAEDVLTWGDDSRYIRRGGAVRQALDALGKDARIQLHHVLHGRTCPMTRRAVPVERRTPWTGRTGKWS